MALEKAMYHVIIEIENSRCKCLEIMSKLGVNDCKLIDIRRLPEGPVKHLVRFPLGELSKVSGKEAVVVKSSKGSNVLASIQTEGCDICNTILSQGAFLISGRHLREHRMIYEFIVSGHEVFKQIISMLESLGFNLKVLSLTRHDYKEGILTEKQENVLWLALRMGYFDYPRKINTKELAQTLGIVPSTLSEIVRNGIRKLLEKYFESKTVGE